MHNSSDIANERRSARSTIDNVFVVVNMPLRLSMLVALFNRVAFVGPVRAEVVGEIEYLHVGKTHLTQFCKCWSEVRTPVEGTAPTINHNEFLARKCTYSILQLLDSCWLRSWPYVFRAWNMRLSKKHMRSNLQNQGLVHSLGLLQVNQNLRLQPLCFGNG